jgi:hypothetical protein
MRARGHAKQRPYPRRWARRVRRCCSRLACGAKREVDGASPAGLRERGRGACLNRQPHASRSYGARDRAGCSGSGTDLPLGCSPARLPSAEERTPRRSPASHGRTGQTSWSKQGLRRPHRTGTASRSPPRRLMSAPHENRTSTSKHNIGLLSRDRIGRDAPRVSFRGGAAEPGIQMARPLRMQLLGSGPPLRGDRNDGGKRVAARRPCCGVSRPCDRDTPRRGPASTKH